MENFIVFAQAVFLRSYHFGHQKIRALLDLSIQTGLTFNHSLKFFLWISKIWHEEEDEWIL